MRTYKLTTNEVNDKVNPGWSEVEYSIDVLRTEGGAFVTLVAEPPVANVVYLQACWIVPKGGLFKKAKGEPHYLVEAQLTDDQGRLTQLAVDTVNQHEVEGIFMEYLTDAQPPDLTGWRDISDEVL